jgi:hypothetical protein
VTDDAAASALSSDQLAELHRWCEVLTGIGAAWSATAGQLRDMPALDCPAQREDALLAAAHPNWHPHEAFHAGMDAVGLIDAAARHVSGLRSLVADHNLVLTPWPLARAVVEHIAHAGWLLDPEITAEQRVARRWMAKLANAYRYRWFASAVHAANTDVKAIKRGRDQVQAELARRFPDADLDWSLEQDPNGPPWVVAGQRYPGLAAMPRS